MTKDRDVFASLAAGDEVAVTLVGKVLYHTGLNEYAIYFPAADLELGEEEVYSDAVVDLYRIEPEPQYGDIFRDSEGYIIIRDDEDIKFSYRTLVDCDGVTADDSTRFGREQIIYPITFLFRNGDPR